MSENVRISCDLKEARGERHKGKTERADGNCKCDEETRNVSAEAKKGIFRKFFWFITLTVLTACFCSSFGMFGGMCGAACITRFLAQ